jgi:phosphoserine aminotransferase
LPKEVALESKYPPFHMNREDIINVTAGPSQLPLPVLEEAAEGLLNFRGTGMGITEISHRSPEFSVLTSDLKNAIRTHLDVPPTHDIIFTQGGGSLQFSAVVLNLLERHRRLFPDLREGERVMDYVLTGSWSVKAVKEAKKLANGATVNIVHDSRKLSSSGQRFEGIGSTKDWKFSPNPAFVYYCDNETIDGVQFGGYLSPNGETTGQAWFPVDRLPPDPVDPSRRIPLVGDHSSSFGSRPIPNLADHALIYAGAQKNLGPAGLTILIARKDLLVPASADSPRLIPTTLDYSVLAESNSLYNTPPMFSMYVSLLVLGHYARDGGLPAVAKRNVTKGNKLYTALSDAEKRGVFKLRVKDGSRSWMNVVFEVLGEGQEDRFFKAAAARGLRGFKGHRCVDIEHSAHSNLDNNNTSQVRWWCTLVVIQRGHRTAGRRHRGFPELIPARIIQPRYGCSSRVCGNPAGVKCWMFFFVCCIG